MPRVARSEGVTWVRPWLATPREAIAWMVARFNDAMQDDAFTSRLVADGYVLVPPEARGPDALAAHTQREIVRWKKVIAEAGITPQ